MHPSLSLSHTHIEAVCSGRPVYGSRDGSSSSSSPRCDDADFTRDRMTLHGWMTRRRREGLRLMYHIFEFNERAGLIGFGWDVRDGDFFFFFGWRDWRDERFFWGGFWWSLWCWAWCFRISVFRLMDSWGAILKTGIDNFIKRSGFYLILAISSLKRINVFLNDSFYWVSSIYTSTVFAQMNIHFEIFDNFLLSLFPFKIRSHPFSSLPLYSVKKKTTSQNTRAINLTNYNGHPTQSNFPKKISLQLKIPHQIELNSRYASQPPLILRIYNNRELTPKKNNNSLPSIIPSCTTTRSYTNIRHWNKGQIELSPSRYGKIHSRSRRRGYTQSPRDDPRSNQCERIAPVEIRIGGDSPLRAFE